MSEVSQVMLGIAVCFGMLSLPALLFLDRAVLELVKIRVLLEERRGR